MKFAKRFQNSLTPAWEDYYVSYKSLINFLIPFKMISEFYSLSNKGENRNFHLSLLEKDKKTLSKFHEAFQQLIFADSEKVFTFYLIRLIKIIKQWRKLRINVAIFLQEHKSLKSKIEKRILFAIKASFQALLKNLRLLQDYTSLNLEAFHKVLKKHNKFVSITFPDDDFKYRFEKYLEEMKIFSMRGLLHNFLYQLENEYLEFFHKDRDKAAIEISNIVNKTLISRNNACVIGVFFGFTIFLVIILIVLGSGGALKINNNVLFSRTFPIFRGMIIILLYIWLLAWNIYGWTSYHVNYKLLFRFNYHHSKFCEILQVASIFSVILLLSLLWYLVLEGDDLSIKNALSFVPKDIIPSFPWLLFIIYMIFPHKRLFNGQGRLFLLKIIKGIIISPFVPVAWATDQFVSFVLPLKDVEYTICFYIGYFKSDEQAIHDCLDPKRALRGVIMALIPLTFRCLQCLRDVYDGDVPRKYPLINFGKYLVSLIVVILSYLIPIYESALGVVITWGIVAIISALYSHVWDIKWDWGFLQHNSRNRFLRNRLSYNNPLLYYIAATTNLVMRCVTMLSISSPVIAQIIHPEIFALVIGIVEIIRRSLWNFLKVENAHLHNLGDFDVVLVTDLPFDSPDFPTDADEEAFNRDLESVLRNDVRLRKLTEGTMASIIIHSPLVQTPASLRELENQDIPFEIAFDLERQKLSKFDEILERILNPTSNGWEAQEENLERELLKYRNNFLEQIKWQREINAFTNYVYSIRNSLQVSITENNQNIPLHAEKSYILSPNFQKNDFQDHKERQKHINELQVPINLTQTVKPKERNPRSHKSSIFPVRKEQKNTKVTSLNIRKKLKSW